MHRPTSQIVMTYAVPVTNHPSERYPTEEGSGASQRALCTEEAIEEWNQATWDQITTLRLKLRGLSFSYL